MQVFVKPRLHDTTGCQTGCTTGLTTGLTTGCIVYTGLNNTSTIASLFAKLIAYSGEIILTICLKSAADCQHTRTIAVKSLPLYNGGLRCEGVFSQCEVTEHES